MRIPPEGAPLHDISRRALLAGGLALAGTAALAACSARPDRARPLAPTASPLAPAPGGRVVTSELVARPTTIDLGGPTVRTWAYGDTLPGPLVRARAGDLLRVRVTNSLETDTSIHWHGIALRNAADGVPGLTQESVAPGDAFDYEFVVPHPGTYFYHPHVGVQLDRGLYAPMIVDDPDEPGAYDSEWIVVLDDWVDGTGRTPDDVFAELTGGAGMAGHEGHGMPGMDGDDDGGDDDGGCGVRRGGGDSVPRHHFVLTP
jgi:multicopper oxidase